MELMKLVRGGRLDLQQCSLTRGYSEKTADMRIFNQCKVVIESGHPCLVDPCKSKLNNFRSIERGGETVQGLDCNSAADLCIQMPGQGVADDNPGKSGVGFPQLIFTPVYVGVKFGDIPLSCDSLDQGSAYIS